MNIILLSYYTTVDSKGGVEKVFCEMANEFVAKGHSVVAVCNELKQGMPFYKLDNNVEFENIGREYKAATSKTFHKIRRLLITDKKQRHVFDEVARGQVVSRLIQKYNPDLIISYGIDSTYDLKGILKTEIPVITMFHSNPNDILEKAGEKKIEALKDSIYVQVLTPGYVKVCNDSYKINNAICIPNIAPQNVLNMSEKKNIIIHVGRFDKIQKQQHILIEAINRVKDKLEDWKVEFWGDSEWDRDYYKYCVNKTNQYGLDNIITFCGVTSNVDKELAKCKIFAFPSASEGFSLALLEAMNAGLAPLVYKSCTGCNEIVEDGVNGILCDDGIEPFADSLLYLVTHEKDSYHMGIRAHECTSQYSPEAVWGKWDELINKCVK